MKKYLDPTIEVIYFDIADRTNDGEENFGDIGEIIGKEGQRMSGQAIVFPGFEQW